MCICVCWRKIHEKKPFPTNFQRAHTTKTRRQKKNEGKKVSHGLRQHKHIIYNLLVIFLSLLMSLFTFVRRRLVVLALLLSVLSPPATSNPGRSSEPSFFFLFSLSHSHEYFNYPFSSCVVVVELAAYRTTECAISRWMKRKISFEW